jgi:hypothetical protein
VVAQGLSKMLGSPISSRCQRPTDASIAPGMIMQPVVKPTAIVLSPLLCLDIANLTATRRAHGRSGGALVGVLGLVLVRLRSPAMMCGTAQNCPPIFVGEGTATCGPSHIRDPGWLLLHTDEANFCCTRHCARAAARTLWNVRVTSIRPAQPPIVPYARVESQRCNLPFNRSSRVWALSAGVCRLAVIDPESVGGSYCFGVRSDGGGALRSGGSANRSSAKLAPLHPITAATMPLLVLRCARTLSLLSLLLVAVL